MFPWLSQGWKGPTKRLWFEFTPVDPLELLDSNHSCHASLFVYIQQNRPVKATACEMGWDPRCAQYEQWHFDQGCSTPPCQQAQSPYRVKESAKSSLPKCNAETLLDERAQLGTSVFFFFLKFLQPYMKLQCSKLEVWLSWFTRLAVAEVVCLGPASDGALRVGHMAGPGTCLCRRRANHFLLADMMTMHYSFFIHTLSAAIT